MLRIVWLALIVAAAAQEDEGPLVATTYGTVRGTRNEDRAYSSFTGIRYAQAPTGRDRFGSASPPPSWDGIADANQNDILCPQIEADSFVGIEDCLTLNVYTPDVASEDNPVAVMVYFYGGGFVLGSVTYYTEDYLMTHDVVVVLVNFRVSALGHLCLRHEAIPGNAAFKDQVAALRWVQQNIGAFGGDPDNVTIMGHSAGGASVDLLTLSPLAEGLFNRAIAVSGTARAFWAVNPDPVRYATSMAETYLGYDGDSIDDLVEFYLNVDDGDLARATMQYYLDLQSRSLPVAACVEQTFPDIEAFLTDAPADIMLSGEYTAVPTIYVVANKEYVNMLVPAEIEDAENLMQSLETHLPTDLVFQADRQRTEIANRVREFYVNGETSILESYVDYKSDSMFYYSVARAARGRPTIAAAPVYLLEFAYESDLRLSRLPETVGITGAAHGDDLLYVALPAPSGVTITAEDRQTIATYTTLLTNFAKYGNPTTDADDLQWLPLSENQFNYLQLSTEVIPLVAPRTEAIALWDQIYADVAQGYTPLVQTAQGLVSGTHHPEGAYSTFTGIRYATAPTGRDRYASPLPVPSWEGIFVADQENIFCPQAFNGQYMGTEDCLILNVYTPDTASETNQLAVIVVVHGGAFYVGSNNGLGPDQLLPHDVVLVTINYRLGPLGFLCLGDELVPGNAAFKDQVAALRWVRENIAAFGGNPDSVTIMGQSAGGASVDLLTLSPMTAGLIDGAIPQSGASRNYWAIIPDPVAVATTMAETYMDYSGDGLDELVEFYLAADIEALSIATDEFFQESVNLYMPFAACVEREFPGVEAFLTDTPANILASGEYISIPTIYTVTNKEYVNMLSPGEITNITNIVANFGDYLPSDITFETAGQRTEIVDRVRAFYVNDETSPLESYIDFMSDTMLYHGIVRSVRERQARSSSPVYVLEFSFESALRLPRLPAVDGITGVGHGDDAMFVIIRIAADATLTEADQSTIQRLGLLFSNFAKHGNPTPENVPAAWPPATEAQFHYLELGAELTVSQSPHAAAVALWDEIYAAGSSARILPSLLAICISALLVIFNLR